MKITVNQIPPQGLVLEDSLDPGTFDLDMDKIKFTEPVNVALNAYRISSTVTVDMKLSGRFKSACDRCLEEIEFGVNRQSRLNYNVKSSQDVLELDADIRQELILDYPVKFLCKPTCRGICKNCGKNLNQGDCGCNL